MRRLDGKNDRRFPHSHSGKGSFADKMDGGLLRVFSNFSECASGSQELMIGLGNSWFAGCKVLIDRVSIGHGIPPVLYLQHSG